MLNLFITRKCNLKCDYCFVSNDFGGAPAEVDRKTFSCLVDWLVETRTPTLALLGGEPTAHPDLLYLLLALQKAGVAPVLFTNALFPDDWAEPLAALAINIVINYNGPEMYGRGIYERREANIGKLIESGGRVSFSKNFAPGHLEYGYLLEGAKRFGVKTIRYDLSRVNDTGQNAHFSPDDAFEASRILASFVRAAAAAGVATGLDCCLPPCLFDESDLKDLKSLSTPFEGTCRPSLDILPDLSALHCWPMKRLSVPNVTAFASETDLVGRMAEMALKIRESARLSCGGCELPPSSCQGGCLAAPVSNPRLGQLEAPKSCQIQREDKPLGAPRKSSPL